MTKFIIQDELEDIVHPDRHTLLASLSSSTAPRFRALNHAVNGWRITPVLLLLRGSLAHDVARVLCR